MSRCTPGWSIGARLLGALLLANVDCSSPRDSGALEPSADDRLLSSGATSRDGTDEAESGARDCRTNSDCPPAGGWVCTGPNEPIRCGPVLPGELPVDCSDDSQCSRGEVCRRDPTVPTGWLGESGLVCAAPCASDRECAPTDTCEASGHCRTRTCDECPDYLSCTNGACVIPTCSADSDCPGGYCVQGTCAGSLGICRVLCF